MLSLAVPDLARMGDVLWPTRSNASRPTQSSLLEAWDGDFPWFGRDYHGKQSNPSMCLDDTA